ncbi:gephyrin-like molybdotransferase Glp [Polycladidibacter stylochi]|uniref:molybdopterin molybdotransferase MoeA n=1 Tax=Polycladidibacter stylochi TaxID=1807766 RepID=UPI00082FDBAD|nr:gephyrin-like molybdotransferase Glp [Pseudovibrio stylochi]
MTLISIEEAHQRLLQNVATMPTQTVPLASGGERILAKDMAATRTQPPFSASAMDGYAVIAADCTQGAMLEVVGEAAAGHNFDGQLQRGQALRIFTGAPVPAGADAILIQENASRNGSTLTVNETVPQSKFIRPAGLDFKKDEVLLSAGDKLGFRQLSLLAAMNIAQVPVYKKPLVAILANGDELVEPGQEPGPNQIIASNQVGVAELARNMGADVLMLGIARDDKQDITEKVKQAMRANADLLVTLGGASVGDHDHIQSVLGEQGMQLDFWRIAMRPGKPLMAGNIGPMQVLGLPGNPVSALVCALLFMRPLLAKMSGNTSPQQTEVAVKLTKPIKANDQRQDYMRAALHTNVQGELCAEPFDNQDSSVLSVFSQAHALIIRPPFAPQAKAGEWHSALRLSE